LVYRDIAVSWSLVFITAILLVRTFPPLRDWKEAKFDKIRGLITFSLPLFFSEILLVLLLRADIIMIAWLLMPADVGIYGVVLKLALFIIFPLQAIDTITLPMMAEYFGKQDSKSVNRIYRLSVHWTLMMMVPVLVIGTIYSKFLLGLFGKEFSAGYICFIVIACGYMMRGAVGSVNGVLSMGGKSKIIFYNSAGALILNITLNYTLIHLWGIVGAALATGLIIALLGLIMLIEAKVVFAITLPIAEILKFFGIGAVDYAAVYMFSISGIIPFPAANFATGSLLAVGIFFTGLKIMGLVTDEDRLVFMTALSKLKSMKVRKLSVLNY